MLLLTEVNGLNLFPISTTDNSSSFLGLINPNV